MLVWPGLCQLKTKLGQAACFLRRVIETVQPCSFVGRVPKSATMAPSIFSPNRRRKFEKKPMNLPVADLERCQAPLARIEPLTGFGNSCGRIPTVALPSGAQPLGYGTPLAFQTRLAKSL